MKRSRIELVTFDGQSDAPIRSLKTGPWTRVVYRIVSSGFEHLHRD